LIAGIIKLKGCWETKRFVVLLQLVTVDLQW